MNRASCLKITQCKYIVESNFNREYCRMHKQLLHGQYFFD
ncbi:hypothetical protein PAECIP111802_03513 [Paenibacillus allorhizosphaerae]|uniref:Uncharacterized protein n=1 Tax=Paenibacillus allorhizosphaerae TaxID=2849866 RepID=A0ABN7TLF8_9BACL|nr:hypothetical protein PAECIP111802_03513 [Paenibacillus allorhizosphaerae]